MNWTTGEAAGGLPQSAGDRQGSAHLSESLRNGPTQLGLAFEPLTVKARQVGQAIEPEPIDPTEIECPDELFRYFLRSYIFCPARPDVVWTDGKAEEFPHDPGRVNRWRRKEVHQGAQSIEPGYMPPAPPNPGLRVDCLWATDWASLSAEPLAILRISKPEDHAAIELIEAWVVFCSAELYQYEAPVMGAPIWARTINHWVASLDQREVVA